jgi:chitosanase
MESNTFDKKTNIKEEHMINKQQKQTAQAIVNIFETDSVLGNYSTVTVLKGDSGHLTFGRSQTTLGSGNLFILIERYCQTDDARYSQHLKKYLPPLESRDIQLDDDLYLKNLLRATADDPIMLQVQDEFFEEVYWQLALRRANNQNITTALGVAIVYDSTIHGSWNFMRHRTNREQGRIDVLGEENWLKAYIDTRFNWLANHRKWILRQTVYRMHTFIDMMAESFWDLPLPMVIRNHEISQQTLNASPKGSYSGPQTGSRSLKLSSPLLRGQDVREMQLALSSKSHDIKADGWFGRGTKRHLIQFQQDMSQTTNGKLNADDVLAFIESSLVETFA